MLMLLFQVGDEPWALAAADIKDLVPLVTLQPLTATTPNRLGPDSRRHELAGLLNYHGDRIPVIDVAAALGHAKTTPMMSTRIAIVELPEMGDDRKLGLILDKAYETVELSEEISLNGQQDYVQSLFKGPLEGSLKDSQSQVVRRLRVSALSPPRAAHMTA